MDTLKFCMQIIRWVRFLESNNVILIIVKDFFDSEVLRECYRSTDLFRVHFHSLAV